MARNISAHRVFQSDFSEYCESLKDNYRDGFDSYLVSANQVITPESKKLNRLLGLHGVNKTIHGKFRNNYEDVEYDYELLNEEYLDSDIPFNLLSNQNYNHIDSKVIGIYLPLGYNADLEVLSKKVYLKEKTKEEIEQSQRNRTEAGLKAYETRQRKKREMLIAIRNSNNCNQIINIYREFYKCDCGARYDLRNFLSKEENKKQEVFIHNCNHCGSKNLIHK